MPMARRSVRLQAWAAITETEFHDSPRTSPALSRNSIQANTARVLTFNTASPPRTSAASENRRCMPSTGESRAKLIPSFSGAR